MKNTRDEIDFALKELKKVKDKKIKKILAIILSRTVRSCRATTHSDLATLKTPQLTTYYCFKHKKICKPLFSIKQRFSRYANDTIKRIKEFSKLKTELLKLGRVLPSKIGKTCVFVLLLIACTNSKECILFDFSNSK